MRRELRSHLARNWRNFGGFLLPSLLSTFIVARQVWRTGDPGEAVLYMLLLAFVLIIYARAFLSSAAPAPPQGTLFQGLRALEKGQPWEREKETKSLVDRLMTSDEALVVVAGSLGVGKSVLIERLVFPALEERAWKCRRFSAYENIRHDVATYLSSQSKLDYEDVYHLRLDEAVSSYEPRLLLVFDQIEQVAGPLTTDIDWLRSFLDSTKRLPAIRILLVVRQDFYYRLRFLGELLPSPRAAFEVGRLRLRDDSEGLGKIHTKLDNITTENCKLAILRDLTRTATDGDDLPRIHSGQSSLSLLPIELQMIGLIVEVYAAKEGPLTTLDY